MNGITVKTPAFCSEEKGRNLHIYYRPEKDGTEEISPIDAEPSGILMYHMVIKLRRLFLTAIANIYSLLLLSN